MKKIVLVVFGGSSFEHRISLDSAQTVIQGLDKNKYDVIPLGIAKTGACYVGDDAMSKLLEESHGYNGSHDFFVLENHQNVCRNFIQCLEQLTVQPDVIFPLIHGINGEDGKMQGMLEFIGIPYIGTGVAGSAICMDKLFTKSILPQYGIPQLPYYGFTDFEWSRNRDEVRRSVLALGLPLFIKPANLGSSIGVARISSEEELDVAIDKALQYDKRILAEKGLDHPREIELSVLGNHDYSISGAGEIVIKGNYDFYTYEAKYVDGPAVYHEIPARIDTDLLHKLQEVTKKACFALSVRGFSRIDFFVDSATGEFYLNELNTIPDMTLDGMLPGLWKYEGVEYSQLLDRLVESALEK